MGGLFGGGDKKQEAPVVTKVETPVVNQAVVDRGAADIMRRRKGAAATVLTTDDGTGTAGAVGAKKVLGA